LPTDFQQRRQLHTGSAIRILTLLLSIPLLLSPFASAQYRFLENGNPTLLGSDAGYLLDTPTRRKIDLSGSWDYSLPGGPSGTVRVPCAFDFRGAVAFQRSFELTKEEIDQHRFHLVCFGVNYSYETTVNGEFVGSHLGGYTSTMEAVPRDILQVGRDNAIRLAVTNELDPKVTLPTRLAPWGVRNYGGITRDIYLMETPPLFIRDAALSSELSPSSESAKLTVHASIEGSDSLTQPDMPVGTKTLGPFFSFEIVEKVSGLSIARSPAVPITRKGTDWDEVKSELLMQNPKLWSPENPELYLVKCYLTRPEGKDLRVIDEYDLTAGIRKITIAGGHILLNGSRLSLRGVTWYEDHPTWGSSIPDEERERDVVMMKTLGANLVRFIDHPPHPYMLNLCDRYGLLAIEELPLSGTPGPLLAAESYGDLASAMLREMILRDRNHPSVMAWGLGDELDAGHEGTRLLLESLTRLARTMDSRPLYMAALPGADSCTQMMDIAALSLHAQDLKTFRSTLDAWRSAHSKQPAILVRFGTEVQPENRGGTSDPLSQEGQARFYLQRFEALRTMNYEGAVVWSFNDWKGDRPSLMVNSGNPWIHTTGLVSGLREKRLAFDAVRSVFHGEKFIALPSGSHSSGAPLVYVFVGFVVLITLAYLYNANRRFRDCLKRSMLNSYNFFADVRDQRSVSLGHSTILGLVVSLAVAIVGSSILLHFRDSEVLDNLLSYLLISDWLKEAVVRLIWNPLECIGVGAAIVFFLLIVVAGMVHVLRLIVRVRIFAFHAYTVTMWSTGPLLILVPVGMVLYRVLDSSMYVIPVFALLVVLALWVLIRLLKGVSIISDVRPVKVYATGLLAVATLAAVIYVYYDYTQAVPMYLSFLHSTMINTQ